jgi:hypothetical protein
MTARIRKAARRDSPEAFRASAYAWFLGAAPPAPPPEPRVEVIPRGGPGLAKVPARSPLPELRRAHG